MTAKVSSFRHSAHSTCLTTRCIQLDKLLLGLCATLMVYVSLTSASPISSSGDYDQLTNIGAPAVDESPSASDVAVHEQRLIPQRNIRTYTHLKDIASKRASLRYLQNMLAALDDKLEKMQKASMHEKRGDGCLSEMPGGDCQSNEIYLEGVQQGHLRPGGRNPGRKRRSAGLLP